MKLRVILQLLLGFGITSLSAQTTGPFVLTEFKAVNWGPVIDEDGDDSDWIELYNTSASEASLAGWSLTDEQREPRRWRFPDVRVEAGGFVIVFASGKDRRDVDSELHTNFRLSSRGEYLALVSPSGVSSEYTPRYPEQVAHASFGAPMALEVIPLVTSLTPLRWLVPSDDSLAFSWTHPGYDDSLWEQAVAPIGFDERDPPALIDEIKTSVADRMRGQNAGVFLRIPFDLSVAIPRNLTLRVRYNDGFVAFLNGQEVVQRNARSPIGWNTGALSRRSLAEVRRFEHIDISEYRDFLESGSNLLAIQALNQSANDADFFFVAELDGLEVQGVDTLTSGYFQQQTPGWPNGGALDGLLAPPSFSHASRILTEPISLELIANAMTTEIRYTLDGSTPDEFSPIYTEPIRVDANADVRARAFGPGRLRSATSQRVFMMLDADLADWSSDLPIVVVDASGVIPQNFIFSHLFVLDRGADGRVSLTDPVSFTGDVGVKVRGNSTTGRPKKTYGVEIRNERGTDRAAEILGMPTDSDWVLYGAFNNDLALMRNAYMYELSNQVGLYAPRTRFCEVFVNSGGSTLSAEGYAGVYSIMEKIKASPQRVDIQELDSDDLTPPNVTGSYMMKIDDLDPGDAGFFAANQRLAYVEPKEAVIKLRPEQVAWIRDYIDAFGVSLEAADVTSPDVPIEQKTYADFIDVDVWIDYHILIAFSKDVDGLTVSTYMYKDRGDRLVMGPIWDFDRSMFGTGALWRDGGGDYFSQNWWNRLFEDPVFFRRYKDRWLELRKGALSIPNLQAIFDGMRDEILEGQERNFEKWGVVLGESSWEEEVADLRDWLDERAQWIDSEFIPSPIFSSESLQVDPGFTFAIARGEERGELYYTVNGTDPREPDGSRSPEALLFTGDPIEVNENVLVRARTLDKGFWSAVVEAGYVTSPASLVVTEIMYNPATQPGDTFGRSNYEFVEIQNVGDTPVPLAGVELTGLKIAFTGEDVFGGDLSLLGPGEFVVAVKNIDAFVERYGAAGIRIGAEFPSASGLSNSTQSIVLRGSFGTQLQRFSYVDTWHPTTDGEGLSLVIRDSTASAGLWDEPEGWRPSAVPGGSPGREDAVGNRHLPGDVSQDGRLSVGDPIELLRFLFRGVPGPVCTSEEAKTRLLDVNGDAVVDLADAIDFLNHLFERGSSPVLGNGCILEVDCQNTCL